MPKLQGSKSTGSVTWVLQRVTGVVLILLLLAHFWVQHFFIHDFYGQMNIVHLNQGTKSFVQKLNEINPLWGKHPNTYIAPVRKDLKKDGSPYYLSKKAVKKTGPVSITIVKQDDRTEILKGRLERRQLKSLLKSVGPEAEIIRKTINSSQLETSRMINHSDVRMRVSNIWWKTYNLLFLVLAIYHGLTGMWDVLKDYKFPPLLRLSLYGSVVTFGLVLLVVGLMIIVPMGL